MSEVRQAEGFPGEHEPVQCTRESTLCWFTFFHLLGLYEMYLFHEQQDYRCHRQKCFTNDVKPSRAEFLGEGTLLHEKSIDYIRSDIRNLSRYMAELEELVEIYRAFALNATLTVPTDKVKRRKILKKTQKVVGPQPVKQPDSGRAKSGHFFWKLSMQTLWQNPPR
jgi:hypothetical protein